MHPQAMQGAEDDDSWMRDGAGDLERELAAREQEMTGAQAASSGTDFDPDSLAQRFRVRTCHYRCSVHTFPFLSGQPALVLLQQ